jgi:hypothetical protein
MKSYGRRGLSLVAGALLLFGIAAESHAQAAGTVQGRVVDASSREPLASVQVSIPGTQRGTLTDREGNFRIPGVPAGQREVSVELIGYTSDQRGR